MSKCAIYAPGYSAFLFIRGQNRGQGGSNMSKHGNNIRKRKDGRWEARIKYVDITGNSKYHSVYAKSYKEAKEKKELFIKEQSNRNTTQSVKTRTLYCDVLDMWMESRFFNQKESTKLKYQNIITLHISPILGKLDISLLNDVVINRFLSEKKENGRLDGSGGLSNSYVKTMAIIISSSLSYAVEKGLREPLFAKIQKPVIVKKEIDILSEDEQRILEEKLNPNESLTALGVLIALNTGLRIGEICALKWEDIDLNNRILHVRHSIIRVKANNSSESKTELILGVPKTKTSVRDIPIHTKLQNIFNEVASYSNSQYVVSGTNNFVSIRTFEYRFHRLLALYRLTDTNFHSLRHTFATRCVEKNIDIKTLSEILGHANVGITLNTYVHPSFETKRTQLEKLCNI